MDVLLIFDGCPGDILCVSWRYLTFVLEIFGGCFEDISWVFWRYLMGVLKIIDKFPGDN